MKQIINCKQILSATFLLLGMGIGQANAEYFQRYTQSSYDQAGLDDVALKKSQGVECSYYGNGNPPINDVWNGFHNAAHNKGYGGIAYINSQYNGIDLCGQSDTYDGCDRVLRTNNILEIPGRGFGTIFWNGETVSIFASGVYYDKAGNPTGVYDKATNSVTISGYKYFPYGKSSGRFSSYLREVCRIPVNYNPTFVEKKTESRTLTCPSSQPNGTWIQERSYDLYTDGSQKNATEWADKTKTCAATIIDSGISTRTVNCPAPQTGLITQGKGYQKWSDGRIEFTSGWSVQSNTCALPKFDVNDNERKELCPEGYTGFKSYKWVLKYKNVEYTTLDEDGVEIKYTLSTPYEEEVLNLDACKLIASVPKIESKPGSESITCDAYYGSAKGTYVGDVVTTGNYVTAYSSVTKQTTTVFNAASVDASSCKQDSDKSINGETRKVDCPVGQNGQITEVRYVATDSKGNVTYPYGSEFTVLENNCSNPSIVDNVTPPQIYDTSTLIQNLSLSSTMLSDAESADEIVSALSQKVVKKNEMHKLNLEINDLTPANFNRESVSRAIKTFSRVAGSTSKVHIRLPTDIQMYVGNGELLDASNKSFSSVRLNSNNDVEMSYFEIDKKIRTSSPQKKTIVFSIFSEEVAKMNME
ncbi:hypothetical protein [Pseudomonas sp. ML2-2023-6]|uniref:hypothetical protein n=1 Tax=Pseudomonas sp. ML2-2023-6 TaxID=3122376 RepID=UPI0030CF9C87